MPSYLIRRRNKLGQFVHVDTIQNPYTPIDENYLRNNYGIGVYNVLMAIEGSRGLTNYGSFTVVPHVEFLGYDTKFPTTEEIKQEFGTGNYLVAKISNAKSYQVYCGDMPTESDIEMFDKLQGYAPALRGYAIFRVNEY